MYDPSFNSFNEENQEIYKCNEELAKEKFNLDERIAFSEEERKDFDSEKKAEVAEEELKLLKSSSKENRTAIVSPNS